MTAKTEPDWWTSDAKSEPFSILTGELVEIVAADGERHGRPDDAEPAEASILYVLNEESVNRLREVIDFAEAHSSK